MKNKKLVSVNTSDEGNVATYDDGYTIICYYSIPQVIGILDNYEIGYKLLWVSSNPDDPNYTKEEMTEQYGEEFLNHNWNETFVPANDQIEFETFVHLDEPSEVGLLLEYREDW